MTLVNYTTGMHYDLILSREYLSKNKNVFGAVIFNTMGVILGIIVTLILLHKNKNKVSGVPGWGCTKIRIFAFKKQQCTILCI